MEGGIAGNSCIVDEDIDRSEIFANFLHPFDALFIAGDVPFIDRNSGLFLEFGGCRVIAGVIGSDFITSRL
jgi:hypothetical protein